jgi:gamma-glutamylcyclotransferase (GGCT)/AIG2-like uncharacterized protein YtfP
MGAMRIFVYGTLMPGEPLWPALTRYARRWTAASAPGRLWDTGHGYPGVRFAAGGEAVPGVVVDLEDDRVAEAIEVLDEIEEEGRLYRRVEVVTSVGPAFAYEWLGAVDGLRPLPDGWPGSAPAPPR